MHVWVIVFLHLHFDAKIQDTLIVSKRSICFYPHHPVFVNEKLHSFHGILMISHWSSSTQIMGLDFDYQPFAVFLLTLDLLLLMSALIKYTSLDLLLNQLQYAYACKYSWNARGTLKQFLQQGKGWPQQLLLLQLLSLDVLLLKSTWYIEQEEQRAHDTPC